MNYEKKIEELFIELPEISKPLKGVVSAVQTGKILYVGGLFPFWDGKIAFKGRLGLEVTADQGMMAARYALLHGLSAIRGALGSLNKVEKMIQLTGFLATGGDFKDHDRVLDAASNLLSDIFGSAGKHARIVSGVMSLPHNACLELALILEVK
ncbi:MAG: RidA family protein [Deltaproteobacteria bacterium]|nr:RidA family protein [Deltaproteobacteria bacterium]